MSLAQWLKMSLAQWLEKIDKHSNLEREYQMNTVVYKRTSKHSGSKNEPSTVVQKIRRTQ